MKSNKYNITFGEDFGKRYKLDSLEIFNYYDNKKNKKIGDIKDFITCFNDNICICMLKLYNISKGTLYNSYSKFEVKSEENENNILLKDIPNEICIAQIKKECTCNF